MSKKRKLPKSIREQRRLGEAQKAVGRDMAGSYVIKEAPAQNPVIQSREKDTRFTLPIKEIKLDMLKNLIYMVITVVALLTLKFSNLNIGEIIKVLSGRQ